MTLAQRLLAGVAIAGRLVACALPCVAACAPAPVTPGPQAADSAEIRSLKGWALARCLAAAAGETPSGRDATGSAAAYLEQGTADIETYERMERLVVTALAEPRGGSVPGEYATMKCIDLFYGAELDDVVRGVASP